MAGNSLLSDGNVTHAKGQAMNSGSQPLIRISNGIDRLRFLNISQIARAEYYDDRKAIEIWLIGGYQMLIEGNTAVKIAAFLSEQATIDIGRDFGLYCTEDDDSPLSLSHKS
jgi:hypothetical protein